MERTAMMFAYVLRTTQAHGERAKDIFRRFKESPGLLHAYLLQGEADANDAIMVAIWESREAAERHLAASPLPREWDQTAPDTTRPFYTVLDSK
jgi:heme-degrading monooxygenase HmoA